MCAKEIEKRCGWIDEYEPREINMSGYSPLGSQCDIIIIITNRYSLLR
jgi:hypothetical protein